jgi:hypothetical protein
MKIHLLKLKAELKVLAQQIKTLKPQRKQLANGYVPGLAATQHEFRYKHIAYCLLRGRTLEQIENKVRDPNDWGYQDSRKRAARIVTEILEATQNAAIKP